MNTRAFANMLTFALPVLLTAQEGIVDVPVGREFQQDKMLTPGLCDRWQFDVEQGEFVQCVVHAGTFDPVLELVDADGERLAFDDGAGTRSELRWFAPVTGSFTFLVRGYEGRGGGNYHFSMLRYRTERIVMDMVAEHVFGPERWWHYRLTLEQGDVIVPRVPSGGRLTAVLDLQQRVLPEWHGGYTAQAGGDVLLRVEGNERDRCRVHVQLARQRQLSESGMLADELPEGGMHIVEHRFAVGAWTLELDTPDHDLAIDFRETKPTRQGRFVWTGKLEKHGRCRQWLLVREPMAAQLILRNHGGSAGYRGRFVRIDNPVTFGVQVAGQLPLGGGQVFELPTEPGQLVRLSLDGPTFDGRLNLWTPDGAVSSHDDGARLDLNPQLTFLVRQRGVHRVMIYASGGAGSGPFTLCAESLPIPRLVIGEALPVSVRDGDAFAHLGCEAGQALWLSVQSRDFDAALHVLDPDGNQVGSYEGGGIGGDVLHGFLAQRAGVHTLQIVSRSGAGDCVLRAIAP